MLLIVFWQLAVSIFDISYVILPSPWIVTTSFVQHFNSLMYHTGITLLESVIGFVIGSLVGFLIAILFLKYSLVKDAGYPYMVAIKATPLIALAPLYIIWFGNGIFSKIMMAATIVFFPVLVNSYKGLSSVSKEHLELFNSFSASSWQVFWKLRVPTAAPLIFSAFRIGSTFSLVGATIAEFTGAAAGGGHLIMKSSYYLDMGLMFATIIVLAFAGMLFFKLVAIVEKKVVFWVKEE